MSAGRWLDRSNQLSTPEDSPELLLPSDGFLIGDTTEDKRFPLPAGLVLGSVSASVQFADIDGSPWRRQTERCACGLLGGDCGFLCIVDGYNMRLFEALWLPVLTMAESKSPMAVYSYHPSECVSQCRRKVEAPTAEQTRTRWVFEPDSYLKTMRVVQFIRLR